MSSLSQSQGIHTTVCLAQVPCHRWCSRRRAHVGVLFGEQDSVIIPQRLSHRRRNSQPCQQEVPLLRIATLLSQAV